MDIHIFVFIARNYNALFLPVDVTAKKVLGGKIRQHLIFDVLL